MSGPFNHSWPGWPGGQHFAGVDGPDLGGQALPRHSRRRQPHLKRIIRAADGHRSAGLGNAVAVQQRRAGKRGLDVPDHRGRADAQDALDPRQALRPVTRIPEHVLDEVRERRVGDSRSVLLDGGNGRARLEVTGRDEGAAPAERADQGNDARAVEHRARVPHDRAVGEPEPVGHRQPGVHHAAVVQRAAFRPGRRARGVEQERDVQLGRVGAGPGTDRPGDGWL